ncbi:MAG TPA: histidine ammonia-lyase [Candidatus Dormibacteraeota bacterium]|jgi:histidine ammonia-lyase|nr:histidine ammonia-lyase [Candidatus Dormibacteraeota bacterium]
MVMLDGSPLSIAEVVAVARRGERVEVSEAARERMRPAREVVEAIHARDEVVYGVTTGFGALAERAIARDDRATLQRAVVRSHAAGMGPALSAEVVRGMVLLRARTLCAGYSGVRPLLVDAMVAMLNAGVVPWVPAHGSLGASGDLAPLAHAAACLMGEGWALAGGASGGERVPAAGALRAAGLSPVEVGPKEGLALINGTDAMCAGLSLAVYDLTALLCAADAVCAMSVEALLGTEGAFDQEIVALRPSPGQQHSAANLRALLAGSPMVASHRTSHHAVQDAYSLRCAPQVHGAARDVLEFARATVERELASVVDNPLVLVGRGEVASSGNFHGQALAYAADMCASLCADVASISERRVDRMLDPARSRGLPAFLTRNPGVNSGLMIAHYTSAACVVALRAASAPIAVHSIPVSAGQEDHVSMGWNAALRTRTSVDDLRRVLAIEAVCAAQALELRAPLRPGEATGGLVASLRDAGVAFLEEDRVLAGDLLAAETWLGSDAWSAALSGLGVSLA